MTNGAWSIILTKVYALIQISNIQVRLLIANKQFKRIIMKSLFVTEQLL